MNAACWSLQNRKRQQQNCSGETTTNFLFSPERIRDVSITDKDAFAEALAEYIATMRVTIEVCPTSNLQTIPEMEGDIRNHPVKQMLDYGMAVAVGTDNTLISHTNINRELALVSDACQLDIPAFKRLVMAGFKGAFYPGRYREKRTFVRNAAERFEKIVSRSGRGTDNGAAS